MANLNQLKEQVDRGARAVRRMATGDSAVVYRVDGMYRVTDLDDEKGEEWQEWENALDALGEWSEYEDWYCMRVPLQTSMFFANKCQVASGQFLA